MDGWIAKILYQLNDKSLFQYILKFFSLAYLVTFEKQSLFFLNLSFLSQVNQTIVLLELTHMSKKKKIYIVFVIQHILLFHRPFWGADIKFGSFL